MSLIDPLPHTPLQPATAPLMSLFLPTSVIQLQPSLLCTFQLCGFCLVVIRVIGVDTMYEETQFELPLVIGKTIPVILF